MLHFPLLHFPLLTSRRILLLHMSKDEDRITRLRTIVAAATTKPGIYRWRDKKGDVLYVGKAKNLRKRLRSYLPKKGKTSKDLGPWKQSMLGRVHDVDTTVTSSELEAFVLETNLIKTLKPKYNVLMKDDKNYVYVRISIKEPFPSVSVIRCMEDDKASYFGPFVSAQDTRRLLDALHVAFPYKASKQTLTTLNRRAERDEDVNASVFDATPLAVQIGKECALGTDDFSQVQYRDAIDQLIRFFRGDRKLAMQEIRSAMADSAQARQFERAALLRDSLRIIQDLEEQQTVSDTTGSNADIVGVALMGERVHIVVMHERDGKLIAEQSVPLRGAADDEAEVLAQFLPQYYASTPDIPETIVIGAEIEELPLLEKWIAERLGRRVEVITPQRGKRAQQLYMAQDNARAKLLEQLERWEAAAKNVADALKELKMVLDLSEMPDRIEGYDISHHSGTETVGSMVVMRKGKPANDHYRSFTIRTLKDGQVDDYAALKEVLSRRLLHLKRDLRQEAKVWGAEGITFGKARKTECDAIQKIINEYPDDLHLPDPFLYKEFLIARKGKGIVGFVRLSKVGSCLEAKSLWVQEKYRGKRLGHFILRKLMDIEKKEKIYITTHPKLHEYYAEAGFRHVHSPPKSIQDEMDEAAKEGGEFLEGMAMVSLPADRREDISLSARPDLIIIDGGKGQLSTVTGVLKELHLKIPVIGLAKREEEVFIPSSNVPIVFTKDSQAKFLLMRLRDEAHRFANRHREKRGAVRAVQSSLDAIPGIGDKTKERLLEKFGTVSGIRDAADDALLKVLSPRQLQDLREHL